MKTIQISKTLKLPADVVTQTLGIIARKGAGKSYLAMLIMEGLLDMHAQVVALDPVGNWWGLRLLADGKTRGYDIPVIGGAHGDVPLEPEAGELIADLLCGESLSAIIDVSEFSEAGRKRFVTAFARKLLKLKREKSSPIHVMLEEAQLFAPQQVRPGDAPMVGAIQQIVRLGRNYGIGSTLISQRPQSINKEVLSQVELLCVLQLIGAHERRAIKEWIVNNATDTGASINDLPNLAIGEAMVWSPQWLQIFQRHKIRKKKTFDASATPKFGGKQIEPRRLAKKEIKNLETAMAEVIERVAAKDPVKLRAEIKRYKIELNKRDKTRPAPDPEALEKAFSQGERGAVKKIEKFINMAQKTIVALQDFYSSGSQYGQMLGDIFNEANEILRTVHTPASIPVHTRKAETPRTPDPPAGAGGGSPPGANGDLRAGAKAMLQVLVQRHPVGLTRAQVSTLSGRSQNSSEFRPNIKILIDTQSIVCDGDRLVATEQAVAEYGYLERIPTDTESLVTYWKKRFPPLAGKMLDELVSFHGTPINFETLSERIEQSLTSSAFMGNIRDLEKNGLVERVGTNEVKASDSLFAGV